MFWKRTWLVFICCSLCLIAVADEDESRTPEHKVISFSGSRTRRIDSMCGPYCLWQVSRAFGKDYSVDAITEMAGTSAFDGTTFDAMVQTIRQIGLFAIPVKTKIKALAQDPSVAILLLYYDNCRHYVILDKIEEKHVRVLDGREFRNITLRELESLWKGHAILINNKNQPAVSGTQRYLGIALQILGGLVLLAVAVFSTKCLVVGLQRRRRP